MASYQLFNTSYQGYAPANLNNLTPKEQALFNGVVVVMPDAFVADAGPQKVFGLIDLVVNDMNWWLPYTNFDRNSIPDNWIQTVILGTNVFAQVFKQMDATLQDFSYNDNGLTVQVDQVGKLNTAHANMLKIYSQQVGYIKKAYLLQKGVGLGTPRFQSQIGQFLKLALGHFSAHTKIVTKHGWRNISDIKIGDQVLSHDKKFHKVLCVYKKEYEGPMCHVQTENSILAVTSEHHIFDAKKKIWLPACEFKPGKKVLQLLDSEKKVEVIGNAMTPFFGTVYDLEVDEAHTYNAEGIIVHNSAFSWNSIPAGNTGRVS